MYAIFKSGGKQYKVAENDVVKLEKIDNVKEGDVVTLDQVLALGTEKGIVLGEPLLANTVVSAEVIEQGRDDKVLIFKKKRRHNYRRKRGHRQSITVVRILDVSGKGEKKAVAPKKKTTETVEKDKSSEVEAKKAEPKKAAPAKKAEAKSENAEKKPAKAEAKRPAKAKKDEKTTK